MRHTRGFTISGFIAVLCIVCLGGVMTMKVAPMYLEFRSVKTSMKAMSEEQFDGVKDARDTFLKKLSINYVDSLTKDDITITPVDGRYEINVDYYVEKPLVGNLSLTAHFEHTVTTK